MTPEELKAERAALERAIAQRQRQIDADEMQQWCAERETAKGVNNAYTPVTKTAPAPRAPAAPAAAPQRSSPFTPAETSLLTAAMGAVAEVLNEEQKKVSEAQRQMRDELQDFCRREVDRMCQRLRNEALQDRLDVERQWRAAEQERRHRGASGLGVNEMIDVSPNDMN